MVFFAKFLETTSCSIASANHFEATSDVERLLSIPDEEPGKDLSWKYFNLEEDLDFYDSLPHGALEKERMDAFSHAVTNVFKDKCKISSKLIPNSYCEFSRGGT